MAVTGSFTGNSTLWHHDTGETKIADNGTIYDNEGKIEGHIQKK